MRETCRPRALSHGGADERGSCRHLAVESTARGHAGVVELELVRGDALEVDAGRDRREDGQQDQPDVELLVDDPGAERHGRQDDARPAAGVEGDRRCRWVGREPGQPAPDVRRAALTRQAPVRNTRNQPTSKPCGQVEVDPDQGEVAGDEEREREPRIESWAALRCSCAPPAPRRRRGVPTKMPATKAPRNASRSRSRKPTTNPSSTISRRAVVLSGPFTPGARPIHC